MLHDVGGEEVLQEGDQLHEPPALRFEFLQGPLNVVLHTLDLRSEAEPADERN